MVPFFVHSQFPEGQPDAGDDGGGGGGGVGRPLLAARHPAPHARLGGEEGKVVGVKKNLVSSCNL